MDQSKYSKWIKEMKQYKSHRTYKNRIDYQSSQRYYNWFRLVSNPDQHNENFLRNGYLSVDEFIHYPDSSVSWKKI